MLLKPSLLCPIDFSEASRGALRYAGVVAEHFGARLTVLTAIDPLLSEAADLALGPARLADDTLAELKRFVQRAFADRAGSPLELHFEVVTGKPAPEVLHVARDHRADLIVMSSHGLTGVRKMFFGSTTERVLRETVLPVLVTPAADPGPLRVPDVQGLIRRVLTPVDLSVATSHQVAVAREIASAIAVPLLLLNVVEPVRALVPARVHLPNIDSERRDRADRALAGLADTLPRTTRTEPLVVFGEPAEEIAKVAQDRDAGLIVMGLHSSDLLGPRMGSVTYRVLCLTPKLVLAVPPVYETAVWTPVKDAQAETS